MAHAENSQSGKVTFFTEEEKMGASSFVCPPSPLPCPPLCGRDHVCKKERQNEVGTKFTHPPVLTYEIRAARELHQCHQTRCLREIFFTQRSEKFISLLFKDSFAFLKATSVQLKLAKGLDSTDKITSVTTAQAGNSREEVCFLSLNSAPSHV